MFLKRCVLAVVVILVWPAVAAAQDLSFITRIFSNFHSVSLTGQGGRFLNSDDLRTRGRCGLCGTGIEVMFDVTPLNATTPAHLELGLGVQHTTGIRAAIDSLDLRGAFRSNPSISARVWFDHGDSSWIWRRVVPFVGVHGGVLESVNLRGYDRGGQQYTLETRALEVGLHGGVYVRVHGPFGVFVEPAVSRRRFASIDYKFPAGVAGVPHEWPRSFNAHSWQVRVGAQFRVKEDTPPRLTGTWVPVSLNGQPLPAVASQVPAAGVDAFDRTEYISGALVLEARTDTARLSIVTRRALLGKDGRVMHLLEPLISPAAQKGTYKIDGDDLTITAVSGEVHHGSITPNEVRLQMAPSNHIVVFKRQN